MGAVATTQTKNVDQAKLLPEAMSGSMIQWQLVFALNSVVQFITRAQKNVHDMGMILNHSRGHTDWWTVLPPRTRLPFRPRLLLRTISVSGAL